MLALMFSALLVILPACPTEDSDWCGWNAQEQGNSAGRSFVSLGGALIRQP